MKLRAPFAMALAAIGFLISVGPAHAQQVRIAANEYAADWESTNVERSNLSRTSADRIDALEAELAAMRNQLGSHATGPCEADCCPAGAVQPGAFFAVDLLYWKPRQRGLDYAIWDPAGGDDFTQQSLELQSRAGVRATVGYLTSSGWDMALTYTYFHTRDERAVAGGNLLATRGANAPFAVADARAAANLDYDVLDLEAGRWFHPCQTVSLRGFFGARFATIDQAFEADYGGVGSVNRFTRFQGYGIRAGGEAHWYLRHNISVFGRAATSLMVGDFDSQWHDEDEGVTIRENYFQTVPVLEAALGVNWQRGPLSVQSGYESVTWFNLTEREILGDDAYGYASNDLGLDGYFFRIGYIY